MATTQTSAGRDLNAPSTAIIERDPRRRNAVKQDIFRLHGVPWFWESQVLHVLDRVLDKDGKDVSKWVDATDWTIKQTYRWLGY